MVSKKTDEFYLRKITENCKDITLIVQNINSTEELMIDLKSQNAVMFLAIQIAENAKKISEAFKGANNTIQWQGLIGFRNIIIHDYENIDIGRVYDIVKNKVPDLYKLLLEIMMRNEAKRNE